MTISADGIFSYPTIPKHNDGGHATATLSIIHYSPEILLPEYT